MNRGDRREPIFNDDVDRCRFVEALGEACAKSDWQVHAYCLMNNHFHLVLETPAGNLVAGMRWFLSTYTARFNRRHKLFGHLFSGRYKSLIVDGSGSGYLRTVCDYVHLNPVRAHLLRLEQKLRAYPWSSWPDYLKPPGDRPAWLRVDRLLGESGIPRDSEAGREYLENCLEQRRAQEEEPEEFRAVRRGWCLGDETFRKELLEQATKRGGEHQRTERQAEAPEEKARRLVQEGLERLGWTEKDLILRPKGEDGKIQLARRVRAETSVTWKWIAQRLNMGTWSYVASRLNQKKGNNDSKNQTQLKFV
jgi:REP element-mobilizing transposase RayT